jgi:hypothetical protein
MLGPYGKSAMIGRHRYRLVEMWANKPAVRLVGLGA